MDGGGRRQVVFFFYFFTSQSITYIEWSIFSYFIAQVLLRFQFLIMERAPVLGEVSRSYSGRLTVERPGRGTPKLVEHTEPALPSRSPERFHRRNFHQETGDGFFVGL